MGISKIQRTEIDLSDDLASVPKSLRPQAIASIGEELVGSIKDYLNEGESPVVGHKFPKLSDKYADNKKGGDKTPNLNLEGDLWDAIGFERKGDTLIIGVDSGEQWKADGHNKLSSKADERIPLRRFIPNDDELEGFKDFEKIVADVVEIYGAEGVEESQDIIETYFTRQAEAVPVVNISLSDIREADIIGTEKIKVKSGSSVEIKGITNADILKLLKRKK